MAEKSRLSSVNAVIILSEANIPLRKPFFLLPARVPVGLQVTRPLCVTTRQRAAVVTHCLLNVQLCLQSCRTRWPRSCPRCKNRESPCTCCRTRAPSKVSTRWRARYRRPRMSLCPRTWGPTSTSGAPLCTSTPQAPQVQSRQSGLVLSSR